MSEEYNQGERDQEGGGAGADVKLDDFVGRIVQDPSQPPDLLLLSGYLGASSEEGHVRLYLDEELSRYVEIPNDAIRHTQPLPPEQSPLGGSLVWIDRSAEVLHGKAGAERNKATFLEGQIAEDFIAAGAGTGVAGAGGGQQAEAGGAAGAAAAQSQIVACLSQATPCVLQTAVGPACKSQFGPCIPVTEWPGCVTLTGVFCTRFGPGCRKTLFDPFCTRFGPKCLITAPGPQCPDTLSFIACPSRQICITQDLSCQVSGFVCQPPGGFTPVDPTIVATATEQALCSRAACGQPFDPTIVQQPFGAAQQFGGQQEFAAGAGAGAGGFGAIPVTVVRCPSALIQCRPSQFVSCPSQFTICPSTFIRCQTRNLSCPSLAIPCQSRFGGCESQFGVCPSFVDACPSRFGCESLLGCFETRGCFTEQFGGGPQFGGGGQQFGGGVAAQFAAQPTPGVMPTPRQTLLGCFPSRSVRCPSAVDACPTRFGCETQICVTDICGASQACEPQFGGGGQEQFAAGGAQPQAAAGAAPQRTFFGCFPSQVIRCPSVVDACPTRFGCPSQFIACQSQFIRCQSALDACPTRFNCPSIHSPCITRDFACQTFGRCPSAVDACPTRFGCFETAAGCFRTQQCGGFDPGDVFGGGGGGF